MEVGTDPDVREWAMTMMLVSRALERIGDNAVDVGEQVAFVVSGLFREFSDASHRCGPRCVPVTTFVTSRLTPPGRAPYAAGR